MSTDGATSVAEAHVRVVDVPESHVHRPANVLGMAGALFGIGLVMVLAAYTPGTTAGVAHDVQGFAGLLATILVVPVNVLEGLVTIVVPIAVLLELAVRRHGRLVLESVAGGVLGFVLGLAAVFAVRQLGDADLVHSLSVHDGQAWRLTIPASLAAVTGLLVVAGPRGRARTVRWSWNLLVATLVVIVVTGFVSLPGTLVALGIGSLAGQAVRYVAGARSGRAYGDALVEGIRRAGIDPAAVARLQNTSGGGVDRVYAVTTTRRKHYEAIVLDGDRLVVGVLARWWRALRLRGIDAGAALTLKALADRYALLLYTARAARVRAPRLVGRAAVDDSAILVITRSWSATPLRQVPDDVLASPSGDAIGADVFRQVRRAHAAGLAHQNLTQDTVLVDLAARRGEPAAAKATGPGVTGPGVTGPKVWLVGWHRGQTAAPTLLRRLDLAQMLVLLALRLGAERAVACAAAHLDDDELRALGPLLQTAVLPGQTRAELRVAKGLVADVRAALVERVPEVDVTPVKLTRFSARTVISVAAVIAAVGIVVTTLNFHEISQAIQTANLWWAAAAFVIAALPWYGSGLALVAFSPGRISVWRSTLVQVASSFVALVTPAGIGHAGVNLRFLTKRGLAVTTAVAVAALEQASQVAVTAVVLLVLLVTTGSGGLIRRPSTSVLIAVAAVVLAIVALLAVPAARRWTWAKVRPTLTQLRPRLAQMLGEPSRLALGLGGNVIVTVAYVFAFDASLRAFGHSLALVDVALIFLVGNTLGALLPTPGGLGGIEGALIGGLTASGFPGAIALSATLLFRVVSYWIQVPIGWVAMRVLERTGDL